MAVSRARLSPMRHRTHKTKCSSQTGTLKDRALDRVKPLHVTKALHLHAAHGGDDFERLYLIR